MRVGLIGTGRMGTAITRRLLDGGHAVAVHNRTAAHARAVLDAGATWAPDAASLVGTCDALLTVLLDDRAVLETYERLAASAAVDGQLFIDLSTVRTATTLAVRDALVASGGRLVDAPVAGPPQAAMAGRLVVLAGGSDRDVAAARPLLDHIARRVVRLGPTGAGTTMKLVLMTSMAVYFAGLAEALAMGSQLGLELEPMLDVILDSHGAPPVLHDRAPVLLAEAAGREAPVGFPLAGVRKDLEAVVATAQEAGVPGGVAAAALATFGAASGSPFAGRDLVCVVEYLCSLSRTISPAPLLAEAMLRGSGASTASMEDAA